MKRLLLVALVVAAVLSFTPRAEALPFIPSPCDLAPGGAVQDACKAVTDPVGTGVGAVAGVVGGTVGGAVSDATGFGLDQMVSWLSAFLANTIKSAIDGMSQMLSAAPDPPIGADWFMQEYRPLVGVGLFLCVFLYGARIVVAMCRGRTGDIGRGFVMCFLAMFLTVTGPLFVKIAVEFGDALTAAFAQWGGPQANALSDSIASVTASISTQGGLEGVIGGPLILILLLLCAVLLVLFWMVMLVIRSEIIYLATLAIPFVLPSIIDGVGRFARLYFRTLFSVILAKPVLFGTVVAGAWLLKQGAIDMHGVNAIIGGIGIMFLAIALPFVVWKFLLPHTTPILVAMQNGKDRAVQGAAVVAGAATGGSTAAVAAGAMAVSKPRSPAAAAPAAGAAESAPKSAPRRQHVVPQLAEVPA